MKTAFVASITIFLISASTFAGDPPNYPKKPSSPSTPVPTTNCNPQKISKALTENKVDSILADYLSEMSIKEIRKKTVRKDTAQSQRAVDVDAYQIGIQLIDSTRTILLSQKAALEAEILKLDQLIDEAKNTYIEYVEESIGPKNGKVELVDRVRFKNGIKLSAGEFLIKIETDGKTPRYRVVKMAEVEKQHNRRPIDTSELNSWLNKSAKRATQSLEKQKEDAESELLATEDQIKELNSLTVSLYNETSEYEKFVHGVTYPPYTLIYGINYKGQTRFFGVSKTVSDKDLNEFNLFTVLSGSTAE